MDNRNKTRGQSRTAIYRRNIKKLKRFLTAFSPSGPIFPSPDYLEQQPSINNQSTIHERKIEKSNEAENSIENNDFENFIGDFQDHDNDDYDDDDGDSNDSNGDDSDGNDDDHDENDDSDDNEDNEDNNGDNYNHDRPLFDMSKVVGSNIPLIPNYRIRIKDYLLATVAMSVRHNLSYEATLDMLRWTKTLHNVNCLPTTKTALWKALSRDNSCISLHFYCQNCDAYLGQKHSVTKTLQKQCICRACGPNELNIHLNCFYYVSLTSQIKQLLSIPNIAELLKYRFWRKRNHFQAMEDIYDGEEYKSLCSSGKILEPWYNFSLTFNTDGCKVSNSSNTSAWPVYAIINELPPCMRKKHMLLAAIYVDVKHPLMNNLLRPFVDEIRALYENGITWNPTNSTKVTSKFVVTTSSLDSPARAAVTFMTQFNGYNGCLYCYSKGCSLGRGKFVYPLEQSYGRLRTDSEVRADMECAFDTGKIINGVKGFSSLAAIPSFNICKGVVVEAMHSVYLGVAKQHTKLLLTTTNAPYYVGNPNHINIINRCLLQIKPPSRRSRKPRRIDTYKQWKATEWRNWLDYAPICLKDVLDIKYVNHFALLSEAIHYLNSDSISSTQLDRADHLLKKYVEHFQKYFGLANMTSNIHLMTHITQTVRNWGPIWAHSAFVFESWNKKIIDSITSSHGRGYQIITRFLMEKFIAFAADDPSLLPETKNYITKILKIPHKIINVQKKDKFVEHGQSISRPATQEESSALIIKGYQPSHLICYKKSVLNSTEYRCHEEKNVKFCNSIIYDGISTFGSIQTIAKFKHGDNIVGGVFIQRFQHLDYAFNTQYIHRVLLGNNLFFIEESSILRPGFAILSSGNVYVMKLPNCWESD